MNLLRPCKYSPTNSYHSPFQNSNHNNSNYNNLDETRIINTTKFHRPNIIYFNKNEAHLVKKVRSLRAYSNSNSNEEAGENEDDNTQRKTFLSLEEAGLVEMSGLSTHERFLCRLTISSLNLLRVIAEQEMCSIEELNAGRICDWFLKDKLKREQNIGSAVLQWDDDDPFQGQF